MLDQIASTAAKPIATIHFSRDACLGHDGNSLVSMDKASYIEVLPLKAADDCGYRTPFEGSRQEPRNRVMIGNCSRKIQKAHGARPNKRMQRLCDRNDNRLCHHHDTTG